MEGLTISAANKDDSEVMERLLAEAGQPTGIPQEQLVNFHVARVGGEVVGLVGTEVYGQNGLLRSLSVVPKHQGQGIGRALVETAIRKSVQDGVRSLFLLTLTAKVYFERFGFIEMGRDDVPPSISRTDEFVNHCPVTAVCMMVHLDP